jgi:hypothetical protein
MAGNPFEAHSSFINRTIFGVFPFQFGKARNLLFKRIIDEVSGPATLCTFYGKEPMKGC